ncbi:hypothetical protein ACJIZ3_021401 [Penstemon smallii]|uniref:PGG domain-containing protein n=1 Tax=Penstemon smallii TaxID=265156 RepID=A0ABD3SLM7_9LAMI
MWQINTKIYIYLYLAAKYGRLNNFSEVLDQVSATEHASFGDIVNKVSPAGNTILHLAAKYGNKRTEAYVHNLYCSDLYCITSSCKIWRCINGNSHGANSSILELYYQNNDEEYARYLAAKAGLVNCVSSILEFSTDQERINELFKNKSPIQVALKNKTRDVLEVMLNKNPSFIRLRDTKGRTPLHYAASLGNLVDVSYLLDNYAPCALQRDKSGSFPIHLALTGGHDFPDPGELLDSNGNNILHVAAISGRYNVVMFILYNPYFEELINMKNNQGNQLTWSALKSAGTPRSLSGKTQDRKTPTKTFMAGVYLVVSKLNWLGNVVLLTGSNFTIALVIVFVTLFFLGSANYPVLHRTVCLTIHFV